MGDKTIIPRFFSPILFYFITHYSYPPFPTPRFWCGFSLGMGIFRWEKREMFFFIPHYNYPPFFEKKKLAIFFILSAILQLSPTTIIPPPPLKYRLLKKYGPEITWTRIMMDQNNHGPFGIFFFLWTYFSGPTYVWGFFVLVQNFDRESRARSACDRLCGEKARNGSTGPHISRDTPPTCGTESSEWVCRAHI